MVVAEYSGLEAESAIAPMEGPVLDRSHRWVYDARPAGVGNGLPYQGANLSGRGPGGGKRSGIPDN
jgi:hypothetical protein